MTDYIKAVYNETTGDHDYVPMTPEEIAQYQADVQEAQALEQTRLQAESERQQIRDAIRDLAQGAVGLGPEAWTNAQFKALVCILLHKEGALTATLTLKPLSQWVK